MFGKTTLKVRNKNGQIVLLILSLLLLTITGAFNVHLCKTQPAQITVPDQYPTIQEAINTATPGDTIFVRSGLYCEHVTVNKTVQLVGEDPATTIIDGNMTGTVVKVASSKVNITGFTIEQSGSLYAQDAGVWIDHANYCNIFGNNLVANNFFGVSLWYSSYNTIIGNNVTETADYAIAITQGSNNMISRNNIENSGGGVDINLFSCYNTVSGNNITRNRNDGVCLRINSSNSTVTSNNIHWNGGDGIGVYGDSNKIFGNRVENSGIVGIWLYGISNYVFKNYVAESKYDGIVVDGSRNNNIFENNIKTNGHGIWLHGLSNSVIGNNLTGNCGFGLWLSNSLNNILGNSIQNNGYGLWVSNASNNTLYHNSILNNTVQIYIVNSANFWNNSFKEGNYWSDYSDVDSDLDGIGDTPYFIDASNEDNYPLMSSYVAGDCNHDGEVNMMDAETVRNAWMFTEGELNYNPHVDFNMDRIINIADATIIGVNWLQHA